jgi:lysophospholipase L1-like esterase
VEQRIVAACRSWRWSCVQLRDRFPEFEARHEAPYGFPNLQWGRGHLNVAGHRAVAELLADEIARLRARDLL